MRVDPIFTKRGLFWVDDCTENQVFGTLTIKDGGIIELDILGVLTLSQSEHNTQMSNEHGFTIYGILEDKKSVTLINCFYRQAPIFVDRVKPAYIIANMAFIGKRHLKQSDNFSKCKFSIEGIDEWVGECGINYSIDDEKNSFHLCFDLPEEIIYNISEDLIFEITFIGNTPGYPIFTEAKITQKTYFYFKSKIEKNIDFFISYVYKIVHLLNFLINKNVCLDGFTISTGNVKKEIEYFDVYYRSNPFFYEQAKIEWHSILVRYCFIKNIFETIIKEWLMKYDLIMPSIKLYFYSRLSNKLYLDAKFLSIAQALETYHRRINDKTFFKMMILIHYVKSY